MRAHRVPGGRAGVLAVTATAVAVLGGVLVVAGPVGGQPAELGELRRNPLELLAMFDEANAQVGDGTAGSFFDVFTQFRSHFGQSCDAVINHLRRKGFEARGSAIPGTCDGLESARFRQSFFDVFIEFQGSQTNLVIGSFMSDTAADGTRAILDVAIDTRLPDRSLVVGNVTNLWGDEPRAVANAKGRLTRNGEPYFMVETIQALAGNQFRVVSHIYWWYDSHHHPFWWYGSYWWWWWWYHWYGYSWWWWYNWWWPWWHWYHWWGWSTWWGAFNPVTTVQG